SGAPSRCAAARPGPPAHRRPAKAPDSRSLSMAWRMKLLVAGTESGSGVMMQLWPRRARRARETVREGSDRQQVDFEEQGGVGRDHAARAARAIAEAGRYQEAPGAADFHAGDALVPAGDDLAGAKGEAEGLPAVLAGVEL